MPKTAVTHIQKMAPGPPTRMAVATPPMFPFPTVEASAVESAWKGVISPSPSWSWDMPRTTRLIPPTNPRTWTKPVRMVR